MNAYVKKIQPIQASISFTSHAQVHVSILKTTVLMYRLISLTAHKSI